ncbi:leucyl aminopeptidase [Marisediminitalea aggregata]|uniref:Probable cytosol aminopeptidase n=1 Tax=Marisediminitalea aggregata TaxID=634436 RepID=A0A1M5M712_9ALTE|nr:leucyl aminopeptidase [Marisediminitalea aggregata]MAP20099.1 leucyl aminopeptidase [Alteromonadaceae bacterium]MEC7468922.1 leucyl aminopeptidase [Pseudomonadota bacterium]BBO26491.1 putative cytosol aminopeptidase [Alteromonas sp. I4]MEC7824722.1 leucyl aminopeptidase [Pseudomonadota bacterium]SHG73071.1 leucyl aminopeptidase [Marisediminitalea aggregata]|tara:strand:+ start:3608 stop:5113 length:1506 start_codon:yes stop_codon:yes gene_type:complete
MEFNVKSGSPEKQRSACIVVGVYEPRRLSGVAEQLDEISEGYISNLLRRGDLEGKAGQMLLLHHVPNVLSERVLLVGCGKERELDERQYKQIIAKTIQTLNETGSMEAVCFLTELHVKGRDTYWKVRQAVETTQDTLYTFLQLKSKKGEPRRPLRKIVFNVPTRRELTVGEKAVEHGLAIAKGMKVTKDVANMPPNICNPAYLWDQAQQLAAEYDSIDVECVNEANMADLGMNSYLAVGRGSENESLMSIIHHKGGEPDQQPLVLVGKGLTFDSGGISLKPGEGMDEMKYDMGGAASVLGVMHTVAALNLPVNVIGVLAGCENMPDGKSYRPGDILTTMSGQTVEVLNTDAEGRLVLCDALTYVERFDPDTVIDVATLTGACIIALGKHATGLMSTHNPLAHELLNASEQASDRAWRLPLWDDYQEQLESPFADMTNLGGRPAGSITAGCFLSRFTKKYNWAHLDIAGTAWNSGKNKGATGRPVPMLAQFLMNRAGLAQED